MSNFTSIGKNKDKSDRMVKVLSADNVGRQKIDISDDVETTEFELWKTLGGKYTVHDIAADRDFKGYETYESAIEYINKRLGMPSSIAIGEDILLSGARGERLIASKAEKAYTYGDVYNATSPTQVLLGKVGPYNIWRTITGKYAVEEWQPDKIAVPVKVPDYFLESSGVPKKDWPKYHKNTVDAEQLPIVFDYIEATTHPFLRDEHGSKTKLRNPDVGGYSLGLQEPFPGMEDVVPIKLPASPKALAQGPIDADELYKYATPSLRKIAEEDRKRTLREENLERELEELRNKLASREE